MKQKVGQHQSALLDQQEAAAVPGGGRRNLRVGHFGVGQLFLHIPTLSLSSEAFSKPFFDRLDTFSDAIDLEDTLVLLFLRSATP